MADTKDTLQSKVDALTKENEQLRGQLAAAGARTANVGPAHPPYLSEGEAQDIRQYGVAADPFRGGRVMTAGTAAAEFGADAGDLEPANEDARKRAEKEDAAADDPTRAQEHGIRGFTHVYPSIAPGVLDPEAVGTPGVSGGAGDPDAEPKRDATASER